MEKLSTLLVRRYRITHIKLLMGSTIPMLRRFFTRSYDNILNFGLGRRINFNAIQKVNVTTMSARLLLNVLGGVMISIGATLVILAELGATTTDVLLTGIKEQTGVSIAGASFGFLAILFVIMAITRAEIGLGTVVIPLSVSTTFTFSFLIIPDPHNLSAQLLYFALGLVVIATGVGIGASAGIGMGAYESICLRISDIRGWHPQLVRLIWELAVLVVGISLGGAFGVGTIIAAIATGWILQYMNSAIGDYLLGRRIRTKCQTPLARGHEYDYPTN